MDDTCDTSVYDETELFYCMWCSLARELRARSYFRFSVVEVCSYDVRNSFLNIPIEPFLIEALWMIARCIYLSLLIFNKRRRPTSRSVSRTTKMNCTETPKWVLQRLIYAVPFFSVQDWRREYAGLLLVKSNELIFPPMNPGEIEIERENPVFMRDFREN